MAAALAAAAAHHHRLSSSPAAWTRALHQRRRRRSSSLSLSFSAPASSHGCPRGARALRRAAGGDGGGSGSGSGGVSTGTVDPAAALSSSSLEELYRSCATWTWRGMRVNYLVRGEGPPVLLVHGFGASVGHWRRNIGVLSESYTVYAIDLLGFGASDKPPGFSYTMETWAELILDFLNEVVKRPTVLVGNSVGSLACVIAAADSSRDLVRGLVLLNCAGGMNNKAIVDDWRIKLLLPLLWLIDFLLKQRRIASALFERDILLSVYGNKEAVDDELVEIIRGPADGEGALDAFVSTVTGPPGPSPIALMPAVAARSPVLVLWGDRDPFTPIDGPVGRYFSALPGELPNVTLHMLEGVGHCPHDDRPDLVHAKLLPWLDTLPSAAAPTPVSSPAG
uniref:AB hydrolase-1 domain-containing protein n=1 Tax=Oryza meridionalis TaxID=40149 RepID=A0A0E0DRG8_9ORYZ